MLLPLIFAVFCINGALGVGESQQENQPIDVVHNEWLADPKAKPSYLPTFSSPSNGHLIQPLGHSYPHPPLASFPNKPSSFSSPSNPKRKRTPIRPIRSPPPPPSPTHPRPPHVNSYHQSSHLTFLEETKSLSSPSNSKRKRTPFGPFYSPPPPSPAHPRPPGHPRPPHDNSYHQPSHLTFLEKTKSLYSPSNSKRKRTPFGPFYSPPPPSPAHPRPPGHPRPPHDNSYHQSSQLTFMGKIESLSSPSNTKRKRTPFGPFYSPPPPSPAHPRPPGHPRPPHDNSYHRSFHLTFLEKTKSLSSPSNPKRKRTPFGPFYSPPPPSPTHPRPPHGPIKQIYSKSKFPSSHKAITPLSD